MALLNYINKGAGILGQRQPQTLPAWATQMYQGGAPSTLPSGNPGGVPWSNPQTVNRFSAQPSSSPGSLGDGNDRGGQGFGANGAPGNPGFSMQDILASQANVQPHGYADLPKQFFDPKEMAIGAAVGQLPLGGMLANMGGSMYAALNGTPRSNADIARGFASSLPGVGAPMKLAEWYAGTPYAKNHPVGSYYMGGNADPQAAGLADSLWSKYGASPELMQRAYNDVAAQKNLGGAGNPQAVIDRYMAEQQQTLDNITGGLGSKGWNDAQIADYQNNYAKMGQNYESLLAGGPGSVVGQAAPEDLMAGLANSGTMNDQQLQSYSDNYSQMGQNYDQLLADYNNGGTAYQDSGDSGGGK